MRICGVDPDLAGAAAIIAANDGALPELIDAIDLPLAGVAAKTRIDMLALRAWIETHKRGRCPGRAWRALSNLAEQPAPSRRRSRSVECRCRSSRPAFGSAVSACTARGKKRRGCWQFKKFTASHALFNLRRHHNRAEAALIALASIHGISARAEKAPSEALISPTFTVK